MKFMVSLDLYDLNINIIFLVYGFDLMFVENGLCKMCVVNVVGISYGFL